MIFRGYYFERKEDGGTSRPAMMSYGAVATPIFHSRREAWKFLRGWSKDKTTAQLKREGYRCILSNVEEV